MPKQKVDAVHRYFTFDEECNKSKCKLCEIKLKGKHTSNLKCHLSTKHLPEYSDVINVNKSNQASRQSGETSTKSVDENRVENLKNLCMQLIAVNGRPLAIVSDDPFRKILKLAAMAPKVVATSVSSLTAQSQLKEINEKSVKALIPETAYQIKLKIASEIRDKLVSIKVDSATCSERKFFGVNIQYLKKGKIIVRNLAVLEIFQSQTGDFLKEKLLEILAEFYIETDQIYSLTTDNGSNMKKVLKLLKGDYCSEDLFENTTIADNWDDSDSEIEENQEDDQPIEISEEYVNLELTMLQDAVSNDSYKVRGMLCAAHTLQLAIKDAVNDNVEAQVTFELARKVAKILRLPSNRNLLKIANLKVPIIDCATRWTSKYDMLVRLQSLKGFCENIQEVSRLTSDQFWEQIEHLLTSLKPLYDCTISLQREQLTVGDFYIQWIHCKSKLSNVRSGFASCLLQFMESREITLMANDVVLEALYLDSRVNVNSSSKAGEVKVPHKVKISRTKEDEEGFTLVERKRKAHRAPRKTQCGTAEPVNSGLRVATPSKALYVSRLHYSATADEVVDYVRRKTAYSLKVQQLRSSHYVHFSSFVVRSPRPLQDTIASADFWPKGVVFRRFRGNLPNPTPVQTTQRSHAVTSPKY